MPKKHMDKLDADYLRRLVEKTITAHDGKVPIRQLSSEDFERWNGVNEQGHSLVRPQPEEDTLALYLIEVDRRASKRFTVTQSVLYLLSRETSRITYGTSNIDGKQFKVILQWEKEKRVSPDEAKEKEKFIP